MTKRKTAQDYLDEAFAQEAATAPQDEPEPEPENVMEGWRAAAGLDAASFRTDHSESIEVLRQMAEEHDRLGLLSTARIYGAAADLLEVHDATGISLDDWGQVKTLVEFALRDLGLEPFTPNGA